MNDADIRRNLASAAHLVQAAREAEIHMLRECYPIGSYVRWKHGPYIRAGVVTGHCVGPELLVGGQRVTVYAIWRLLEDEA